MIRTEREIKQIIARGEAYGRLTRNPDWIVFVNDINELIESKKTAVIFDLVNSRIEDRAICWGLRMALDMPTIAVNDAQACKEQTEREQLLSQNSAQ